MPQESLAPTATLDVVPSGNGFVGAEVRGVDLSGHVDPVILDAVREALHAYKVIVLRRQHITPQQHLDFSRHFGTLERHVLPQYSVPGYPELVRVSNVLDDEARPVGLIDAGRMWHSDGAFLERPNMYSMLHALEVPRDAQGHALGSTWFASTADAYDALPESTRRRIEGLRAVNSLAAVYATIKRMGVGSKRAPLTPEQRREVVHPVVRTHPHTGRRCLYVSKAATLRILGMAESDSRALIDELSEWCTQDRFIYRHQWDEGDLLIWDNCASQHLAIGDYALPQRRMMNRSTVGGAVPY